MEDSVFEVVSPRFFVTKPYSFAKVGMTLVIDHSGKVFSKHKPTLKDVIVNQEDRVLNMVSQISNSFKIVSGSTFMMDT